MIDEAPNQVITSTMTCPEIVAILTANGCDDLTLSLDEPACSKYPIASGGLGDVFHGRLFDGTPVAIKTIRGYYDLGQVVRVYNKRAAREIYAWSKCKHPNVVELKGLAVFHECLAMVSRWEENGNLLQYLSRHPSADRCQLITSICAGLVYLHDNDIVHGDLKGANVLIARDGTPMLMDFGNASLLDPTVLFTQTNTGIKASLRWAAPEILEETSSYTTASDVYALGMTILEAFTSNVPFADKSDLSVLSRLSTRTLIPTRPEVIPKRSIYGDKLWAILMKCWSYDPQDRPTVGAVWDVVKPLSPEKLKEIED
ncbi:unnamed protein product [Rhizoctonia solani]|uniref:Protein kinase domain-containing protein n=1 Tax=Rhizoctonia solani TaxID=456999 RepID=A0A8H3CZH8_9AGAM|nr:unnamed protein product [Rhizoctonia solani]